VFTVGVYGAMFLCLESPKKRPNSTANYSCRVVVCRAIRLTGKKLKTPYS